MGPEKQAKQEPKPEPGQDTKRTARGGAFTIPVQMM